MPLKELHEAIRKANYADVESIIINEGVDPLAEYQGETAIKLCFYLQSENKTTINKTYQDMLKNLLLPQADRMLVGNGIAKRGDIMIINDDGSIEVVAPDSKFDTDNPLYRKIGLDNFRLSEHYRSSYANEHLSLYRHEYIPGYEL